MARDKDRAEIGERRAEIPPEPAHDPLIVAQAMRDGVTVEQAENNAEFGMRNAELSGPPVDPVFSSRVNVMDEYNAALEAARQPQGISGPVTRDVILEATATLQRYQTGKANLEARIVENEEYFRLMHNGLERANRVGGYDSLRYRRNTAWLFSAITNKVADFQDNYPEATILPREKSDEAAAKQLTAIIPAILERNGYRKIYRHATIDKVKHGCGIQQIVWDKDAENGQGDVRVRRIDPLNIFWEPGIEDIQQSSDVFTVELRNNKDIVADHPELPELEDHLSTPGMSIKRYIYNDSIDTSDKSYVVNWYYKKRQSDRTVLHYCQYVNDVVLYASENDPRYADEGWYRHGRYPFVFDCMYPEVGTPFGFGEIDIGRDAQEDIDQLNAEIMRNVRTAARRRFLCRANGGINEQEYMDLDKDIVHVEGQLDDLNIREITVNPLSSAVLEIYSHKIDEMKETTANRDVTQGGTGGTQTASGIAALQESGNKVSRDLIADSYESFKLVCELIIELIRQFYDVPRSIRITGDDGSYQFMDIDNSALQSRQVPGAFGVDAYLTAEPVFDVSVKAYKANPYSKQQANQDAINMYGMGFFDPARGVETLACMELLDMDNIDKAKQIVETNYQQYIAAKQMAMQQMAMQQMMQARMASMAPDQSGERSAESGDAAGTGGQRAMQGGRGGSSVVDRARQNAQAGTQPR